MSNPKDRIDVVLRAGTAVRQAARTLIKSAVVAALALRQAIMAGVKRPPSSTHEAFLARSADRFELERRERAWNRWRDGSLLGR